MNQQIRRLFSSAQPQSQTQTQSEQLNAKSYDEKVKFFERFSNAFSSGDLLEERVELRKNLEQNNFSRDVILEDLTQELKQYYGKNYK